MQEEFKGKHGNPEGSNSQSHSSGVNKADGVNSAPTSKKAKKVPTGRSQL